MQRWMLVIAGVLLIAAAAVGWVIEGINFSKSDQTADRGEESASQTGEGSGSESKKTAELDPLVPPIDLGNAGHHPIRPVSGEPHDILSPVDSLLRRIQEESDFTAGLRASFHAHGEEVCASGCAASRHPTKELTKETFHRLLKEYAAGPIDETNLAFETLLYFGRQTTQMLASEGPYPLDQTRIDALEAELETQHAWLEIRVLDENGEIRTWLPPTRVPFDRRHEFDMEVSRVQPLITSGTVKRVGLYHLWTRL